MALPVIEVFFLGGKIWSEGFRKRTIITNWQNGHSEWCTEQGIPVSTYYSWQRKVYQTVTTEAEVCFTEISSRAAGRGTVASIESGEVRIEIHGGADAETIRAIIQAVKGC